MFPAAMAVAMPLECILTITAEQDSKEQYFESSCATRGLQGLLSVVQPKSAVISLKCELPELETALQR